MPGAPEAKLDAAVHEAFSAHARADAGLVEQVGRRLLEHPGANAAQDVFAAAPLEQLALSPQCGFSSTVHGNNIAVEAQRAKLRLVVETAAEVWG